MEFLVICSCKVWKLLTAGTSLCCITPGSAMVEAAKSIRVLNFDILEIRQLCFEVILGRERLLC